MGWTERSASLKTLYRMIDFEMKCGLFITHLPAVYGPGEDYSSDYVGDYGNDFDFTTYISSFDKLHEKVK